MSQYISPEKRAKVLSVIKQDGVSVVDAAKRFAIAADTIQRWIRKEKRGGSAPSSEAQRLRKENAELRIIIKEMKALRKKK